jgi:hypothetical protein
MLTSLGPFARDTEKERIEVVSVPVMDLKTHAGRELLDRIKPFFIFQIGMDIRIIEISCGIESFFLQPEIRIECARSAAYVKENIHRDDP